jgi:hypothetical protein
MNFSTLKGVEIPNGVVQNIKVNGSLLWKKSPEAPKYTDLVPTAKATDGSILDGIGYRRGVHYSSATFVSSSAFTAIGFIPIDGSVTHDIYLYGLSLSGTNKNRFVLATSSLGGVAESTSIKDGFSNTYIASITKLADNYFKITTNTYSTKVKYFGISGVTVSGLTPIVTLDEPII